MVDFADSPAEASFRAEVRTFLDEHGPDEHELEGGGFGTRGLTDEQREVYERWRDALVAKGWIAPHWPKEYGGGGLGSMEQFVLNQELAERGLNNVGGFGTMMIGPTVMVHGTEEQKAELLPEILAGKVVWCQGWSEPGSGSDLASLQTRAVREGDVYVLNGQKIWTSGAHLADRMYMLARTDPTAPKHRGISLLMLDMDWPGVTVRPLVQMTNQSDFNEVFFEDVKVPVSNRLGDENRGWYVGMTLTDFERSGIGSAVGTRRSLNRMLEKGKAIPADRSALARGGPLRQEVAERFTEAEICLLFSFRLSTMQSRGLVPNYESSMAKMFQSEMNQRIQRMNVKLWGLYGQIWDKSREEAERGQVAQSFLRSVANTIEGGTSEIQRNIVATRGLGLPRG